MGENISTTPEMTLRLMILYKVEKQNELITKMQAQLISNPTVSMIGVIVPGIIEVINLASFNSDFRKEIRTPNFLYYRVNERNLKQVCLGILRLWNRILDSLYRNNIMTTGSGNNI